MDSSGGYRQNKTPCPETGERREKYRFVGNPDIPWEGSTYCEHIRQGVEQEFITKVKTAG